MSINPARTARYSDVLRWRIVWQREVLGLKLTTISTNLGVDPSTISRTVRGFRQNGSVSKRPYPKDARPSKKMTKSVELTLLHIVLKNPVLYLHEIQKEYAL